MSIYKWVNGPNDNLNDFEKIIKYVTESYKTDKGKFVETYGCSRNNILRDMLNVKKANHQLCGKQYEHSVWSITPDIPNISDSDYMAMARRVINYCSTN